MYIWYRYICCRFKRKTEALSIFLIRLPFALRANGNLTFSRLFTKKQTKDNRLQNGLTDSMDLPINDHTAEDMLRDSM
jgi:hypothetical protein